MWQSEEAWQLYDNRCKKLSRFQTTLSLGKIVWEKHWTNQRWEIKGGEGWERFLISFVRFIIKKGNSGDLIQEKTIATEESREIVKMRGLIIWAQPNSSWKCHLCFWYNLQHDTSKWQNLCRHDYVRVRSSHSTATTTQWQRVVYLSYKHACMLRACHGPAAWLRTYFFGVSRSDTLTSVSSLVSSLCFERRAGTISPSGDSAFFCFFFFVFRVPPFPTCIPVVWERGGAVGRSWELCRVWSCSTSDVAKSSRLMSGAVAICGGWLGSCTCAPWWRVWMVVCWAVSRCSECGSVCRPVERWSGQWPVCCSTWRASYTGRVCIVSVRVSTRSVSVWWDASRINFLRVWVPPLWALTTSVCWPSVHTTDRWVCWAVVFCETVFGAVTLGLPSVGQSGGDFGEDIVDFGGETSVLPRERGAGLGRCLRGDFFGGGTTSVTVVFVVHVTSVLPDGDLKTILWFGLVLGFLGGDSKTMSKVVVPDGVSNTMCSSLLQVTHHTQSSVDSTGYTTCH